MERVLPGGLTLILPNPARRYPLACGPEPERIGLRVPDLSGTARTARDGCPPVLQSSANPSGGRDARRVGDVDPGLLAGVDAVVDGGELPGSPSTVVDLTRYEASGDYAVLRDGAVGLRSLEGLL